MRYLLIGLLSVAAFAEDPQAYVLGKPIYVQRTDSVSITPDQWKSVGYQIELALIEQYAKVHGLEPTAEEIAWLKRLTADHPARIPESADEYRHNLLHSGLDPQKVDEEVKDFIATLTKQEQGFVIAMIELPKVGRALYRQYGGGRVRLTMFGPEPIDAMEQFLKNQERRGSFSIPDPQGRAIIWSVFQDKSGEGRIVSGRVADAAYEKLPWEVGR